MSTSAPEGVLSPGTPLVREDAEIYVGNWHDRETGTVRLLYDRQIQALETVHIANNWYLHGPIPALGAPGDRWYVFDASSRVSNMANPLTPVRNLRNTLAPEDFTYSSQLPASPTCTLFAAGKADAQKIYFATAPASVAAAFVADDGSAKVDVCPDGFLHDLSINLTLHDVKLPDQKGTLDYRLSLSDFGTVAAPAEPTGAVPPVSAAPSPTEAPVSVPTPTPEQPASTTGGFDGQWSGTSQPNASPLQFQVLNGEITQANIFWRMDESKCPVLLGVETEPKDSAITGKTFVAHLSDSGMEFTFQGTFTTDTQASGTIDLQGTTPVCGAVPPTHLTWSAQKTSP